MTMITQRHNNIIDLLVEGIKIVSKRQYSIDEDVKLPECRYSNQRPDLVLRQKREQGEEYEIILIDIACSFQTRLDSLECAHQRKMKKYDHFVQSLKKEPKCRPAMHTIVIGALGCFHEENTTTYKACGIPEKYYKPLSQLMSKTAISWSRVIYNKALLGERYQIDSPEQYSLARYVHKDDLPKEYRQQDPKDTPTSCRTGRIMRQSNNS